MFRRLFPASSLTLSEAICCNGIGKASSTSFIFVIELVLEVFIMDSDDSVVIFKLKRVIFVVDNVRVLFDAVLVVVFVVVVVVIVVVAAVVVAVVAVDVTVVVVVVVVVVEDVEALAVAVVVVNELEFANRI
jgi:hypothetical protein